MQKYFVDDEVASLVEQLANPKPFENLSFNEALRRVLKQHFQQSVPSVVDDDLDQLLKESLAMYKGSANKTPSPDLNAWVENIPELSHKKWEAWQEICSFLDIHVGRDSARRKLKGWVKKNRPNWPAVPGLESDQG